MSVPLKDIRIFVASSKELVRERDALAFLVLSKEEEFAARGLRVRLAKWEYVDPRMTEARTEDRYLDEMYDCDAAFVLFRNIAGMYTREELDKALAAEKAGTVCLKAHEILFDAAGAPDSDAAKLRASLPEGAYGVWSGPDELRTRFLALVDRVAAMDGLRDAPSDANVRKITAFLAADEELADERDAFADTVLNVNDLLERAHRGIRLSVRFYDPARAEGVVESSEMGLVLYGTNSRAFGRDEIERTYERVKDAALNPKRFYVFFHDLDAETEKTLDDAFRAFRNDFVAKLGHFTCQFGDANALRVSFLLSLERYAGESVELYSTVEAPTAPVFAGRENEMRRLCGLLEPVPGKFPAGRLPVITGAGGTGKSELVRQYASQLRVQYPGGVFQVDMERRKTWNEAFLGILEGNPNNGVKVKDYLELESGKDEGDETGKSRPLTGAEVRDALLRKSRTAGPILLVLDNVEGCMALFGRDGGFRKAFPAGFSERVRVNVVATARVCDVMLRDADWAVPFPLGDLPPEAALEVLLADREADEAERKAAGRVAELLGYRALYLRRVPALIGDLYAQTACDSYAELAGALEENLLATVAEETEETHLPDVLWKMTRERLGRMPMGAECVKLAQVAAFFSPEGFPKHILRHLWKTVVAPGQDERKFERAFAIVRHHNLFQSDDPVRIHRLDRAAILADIGDEKAALEEAIGKALADCLAASSDLWLSLAEFPDIVRQVPETIANGRFYANALSKNPKLEAFCPWEKFGGREWTLLLGKQPQFESLCSWEKFSGRDWVLLVEKQPQFVDRCPWEMLDGLDWGRVLRRLPQFADLCPWEKLNGFAWASLLSARPQFSEKCQWEKLDGWDWVALLRHHPQFADNCSWDKMNGYCWANLLAEQEQFADRCRWETLDGANWAILLVKQPQFAEKCPWDELKSDNWGELLAYQPQFANRCPWEQFSGWASLLAGQPQFADKCPWEKFDSADWAKLLSKQPQFADKCPWEKIDGEGWADLLRKQPQFANKCSWEKLEGRKVGRFPDLHWCLLLCDQPQLAVKCPWEKLKGKDWVYLLPRCSQFANKCPFEKLEGRNWSSLLCDAPQFANHCPWEILNGCDWARLLCKKTQFANKCDWSKLSDEDWDRLLKRQPQFADRRGK